MGGCYSVAPEHGPRIAAIGGGTGLSTLLRGLKLYTKNLTAIVTMADDGGGSGRLRQDLGMLPPGDIRSCLEALANAEPLMAQLMHYRFCEGTLAGQSFGNLFLAALNGIMPSFDRAVESMSQVLAITGRVLPVTTADVQLEATFENGASVVGESRIFRCKKEQDCRIRRVRRRIFRRLGGISPQMTGGVLLWLLVLMMAAWLWYLFRGMPGIEIGHIEIPRLKP